MAWAYLVHLSRQMSASMEYGRQMARMGMNMDQPWTAADTLFTFAMWTVMMIGMMTVTATSMLLLFAGTRSGRGERTPLDVLMFGLGYLTLWTGFSAFATLAQWALH